MNIHKGQSISPSSLAELLRAQRDVRLIDVRTPGEFAAAHLVGARLLPLDELDACQLQNNDQTSRPCYLICHSGGRARKAQALLANQGVADTVVVEGGMEACEAAGLPMERGKGAIPLQRQALIGAGVVVWSGLILGWLVSPWFLLVTAFAGCGLLLAGLADVCLMGLFLAKMPWNRRRTDPAAVSTDEPGGMQAPPARSS